jgi:hypothetical protein
MARVGSKENGFFGFCVLRRLEYSFDRYLTDTDRLFTAMNNAAIIISSKVCVIKTNIVDSQPH